MQIGEVTQDTRAAFDEEILRDSATGIADGDPNRAQIQVAVRVRPLSEAEECCIEVAADTAIAVRRECAVGGNGFLRSQRGRTEERFFDRVFGPTATQAEVFEWTCRKQVAMAIGQGRSATVFVYGATGAGKTHTMFGESDRDAEGLLPRALQEVFVELEKLSDQSKFDGHFAAKVSFLDIYNETVRDLLQDGSGATCKVLEDSRENRVKITNLREVPVASAGEAIAALKLGLQARKVEATAANARSSRSHAVFTVTIERVESGGMSGNPIFRRQKPDSRTQHAKICLIDLAGSERATQTQNTGQALKDGAKINQSLLALANCIDALAARNNNSNSSNNSSNNNNNSGGAGTSGGGGVAAGSNNSNNHNNNNNTSNNNNNSNNSNNNNNSNSNVSGAACSNSSFGVTSSKEVPRLLKKAPFRDSKLTLLLKSSLTCDCLVSMIANVHPGKDHYEDSNNTLEYAKRASSIRVPNIVRRAARASSLPPATPTNPAATAVASAPAAMTAAGSVEACKVAEAGQQPQADDGVPSAIQSSRLTRRTPTLARSSSAMAISGKSPTLGFPSPPTPCRARPNQHQAQTPQSARSQQHPQYQQQQQQQQHTPQGQGPSSRRRSPQLQRPSLTGSAVRAGSTSLRLETLAEASSLTDEDDNFKPATQVGAAGPLLQGRAPPALPDFPIAAATAPAVARSLSRRSVDLQAAEAAEVQTLSAGGSAAASAANASSTLLNASVSSSSSSCPALPNAEGRARRRLVRWRSRSEASIEDQDQDQKDEESEDQCCEKHARREEEEEGQHPDQEDGRQEKAPAAASSAAAEAAVGISNDTDEEADETCSSGSYDTADGDEEEEEEESGNTMDGSMLEGPEVAVQAQAQASRARAQIRDRTQVQTPVACLAGPGVQVGQGQNVVGRDPEPVDIDIDVSIDVGGSVKPDVPQATPTSAAEAQKQQQQQQQQLQRRGRGQNVGVLRLAFETSEATSSSSASQFRAPSTASQEHTGGSTSGSSRQLLQPQLTPCRPTSSRHSSHLAISGALRSGPDAAAGVDRTSCSSRPTISRALISPSLFTENSAELPDCWPGSPRQSMATTPGLCPSPCRSINFQPSSDFLLTLVHTLQTEKAQLNARLNSMRVDRDRLEAENESLRSANLEKDKKLLQLLSGPLGETSALPNAGGGGGGGGGVAPALLNNPSKQPFQKSVELRSDSCGSPLSGALAAAALAM